MISYVKRRIKQALCKHRWELRHITFSGARVYHCPRCDRLQTPRDM